MKTELMRSVVNRKKMFQIYIYDEILIESKSVNTKQMECSLHTQENTHLIHEVCATNQSRLGSGLPHDVFLCHVYSFDPSSRPSYHVLEQT